MNTIRKVFRKSVYVRWALLDQAGISGVNFLNNVFLARILGIAEFGRFALGWTVFLFIQNIQHSAINAAMFSIGPKQEPRTAPSYYGSVFLLHSILVGCNALIVWSGMEVAALFFPPQHLNQLAAPLAWVVLCCSSQDFLRRYFFTVGRPGISLASDSVRYVGQLIIFITMFMTPKWSLNMTNALWIMGATALVAIIVVMPFVQSLQWSSSAFRTVSFHKWHFSKWLVGSALLSWANSNLYFLIAGMILGAPTAGAWRAAQSLVGVTHVLFLGLENVVPKEAAKKLVSGGQRRLLIYLWRVSIVGGLAIALLVGVFATIPSFWLGLLYGDQFMSYSHLVRWQAAIEIFGFFSLPLHAWLRAVEKTRIIFYSYAATAILSITIAYPIITYLGVTGAVIGVLISNAFYLTCLLLAINAWKIKRHRAR